MEYTAGHTASLEDFTAVLKQLTEVVEALAQIEGQKAQAAALSQHSMISGFLNPEQAQVLKLRGLEQKRMRLAEAMGWKGLTFRQILKQADSGQKAVLSPLFMELDLAVRQLASARDSADRAIKFRLRELEAAIADADGAYDSQGSPADVSPSHFKDRYV